MRQQTSQPGGPQNCKADADSGREIHSRLLALISEQGPFIALCLYHSHGEASDCFRAGASAGGCGPLSLGLPFSGLLNDSPSKRFVNAQWLELLHYGISLGQDVASLAVFVEATDREAANFHRKYVSSNCRKTAQALTVRAARTGLCKGAHDWHNFAVHLLYLSPLAALFAFRSNRRSRATPAHPRHSQGLAKSRPTCRLVMSGASCVKLVCWGLILCFRWPREGGPLKCRADNIKRLNVRSPVQEFSENLQRFWITA
jgi:hypothetical protein